VYASPKEAEMNRFSITIILFAIVTVCLPAGAMTLANSFDAENNSDVALASPDAPGASGTYLVVWEHQLSMADVDVMAAVIGEDGAQIGTDLTIASGPDRERYPAVASNGTDEFLVVYEREDALGDRDIYGQRVSTGGALLGNAFAVSADVKDESMPAVAHDTTFDEYVVVWEHHYSATDLDVKGRVVAGDGSPGTTFVVMNSGYDEREPDIASEINGSGFLVTLDYAGWDGDYDLAAQPFTVNADLTVQLDSFDSFFVRGGPGADELSSVAGGYSGEYFVAWHDVYNGTDRIKGRLVTASGTLGSFVHIGQSSVWSGPQPDVMAHGAGGFTVVWDEGTTQGDIKAQEISVYGLLDGSPVTVASDTRTEFAPAIPAFGDVANPLVTWSLYYGCADPDIHATLLP
jgi:hypothetical protein